MRAFISLSHYHKPVFFRRLICSHVLNVSESEMANVQVTAPSTGVGKTESVASGEDEDAAGGTKDVEEIQSPESIEASAKEVESKVC